MHRAWMCLPVCLQTRRGRIVIVSPVLLTVFPFRVSLRPGGEPAQLGE